MTFPPSRARARTTVLLLSAALLAPRVASAQGTLEDYRRAATINQRFEGLTTGLVTSPQWVDGTNQYVYRVSVTGGNRYVKVDADQWTKQPAFDHAAVARALSSVAGTQYTEITLPFTTIALVENGTAIEGNAGQSRYRCTVTGTTCTRLGPATGGGGPGGGGGGGGGGQNANTPPPPVVSPDSTVEAF